MLSQFSVHSYRSYRSQALISMQPANIDEHAAALRDPRKTGRPLLPVAAIYGPSGSGKSNLLSAFLTLQTAILQPPVQASGAFEVFFQTEQYEYRYRLILADGVVLDELLSRISFTGKKSAKIFTRTGNQLILGPSISKKYNKLSAPPMGVPYLKVLAENGLADAQDAAGWFRSCRSYDAHHGNAPALPGTQPDREHICSLLSQAGCSVKDYVLNSEGVFTVHHSGGRTWQLPLSQEAAGTQVLFCLAPLLLTTLKTGGILVVDDLDCHLHPLVQRKLISLFQTSVSNPKGAQLLFSAQNTGSMSSSLLRRDEIWFTELDNQESSTLYPLWGIRDAKGELVRANAALEKQYMEGRYCALPYMEGQ